MRISALELTAIMRMIANKGTFNGVTILKPETVDAMWA